MNLLLIFLARAQNDTFTDNTSSAAIYFDGYLPTSKTETRLQRLCDKSHEAQRYFLGTISGLNKSTLKAPSSPFIVPAVLEALRSQERYSIITHVVPGEADPYCANDVRQNGGALLTGDSDFLLYDLGPTGTVAFFRDIYSTPQEGKTSHISALRYSPGDITQKLLLEPGQKGMLAAGFEISLSPDKSYQALAGTPRTQWKYLAPSHKSAYDEFISEYIVAPDELGSIPSYLKYTDPRVAEFILDWAAVAGLNPASLSSPDSSDTRSTRYPVVHLPLLIDRWDVATSWNASTAIRQLAYSLCQGGGDSISTVTEYRRTLSLYSAGQQVELLAASDVPDTLRDTLSYTREFLHGLIGTARLQWITACLGFEIGHAASEGKESTTVKLLKKASASGGLLDPDDWDAIHLVAMMQGVLYSLRILQQVLLCRVGEVFTRSKLNTQLGEVQECLASMPSIAEYPCLAEMESLFEQLEQAGALKRLSAIVGIEEPSFGKSVKGSARTGKTAKRQQSKQSKKPAELSNPFDALSMDD